MPEILFYVFSALAIVSAAGVVLNARNTINSALSLVVSMLSLAVLFVLLQAEFIGVLQVIVYAGAIVVLFLFVIMLLNLRGEQMGGEIQPVLKGVGAVIVLAAMAKLAQLLRGPAAAWPEVPREFGQTRSVGMALYTDYLLAFEVIGVLLLAGIVAAVILAKKRIE